MLRAFSPCFPVGCRCWRSPSAWRPRPQFERRHPRGSPLPGRPESLSRKRLKSARGSAKIMSLKTFAEQRREFLLNYPGIK